LLRLFRSGQSLGTGSRKTVTGPSGKRHDIIAQLLKGKSSMLCRRVDGKVTNYCFDTVTEFWVEGEVVEVVFSQER
jgi:hypothetical protein